MKLYDYMKIAKSDYKDGNPKYGVRPEAIEANKIAVWAMQQVLELMVY